MYAKPGDVIEITSKHYVGQRYTVIEFPGKHYRDEPGHVWFMDKSERPMFFRQGEYKVVKRASCSQSNDVDESLKRQRDENLRSIFA